MDKGFYVIGALISAIYFGICADIKDIKKDIKPIGVMDRDIEINAERIEENSEDIAEAQKKEMAISNRVTILENQLSRSVAGNPGKVPGAKSKAQFIV